MGTPATATPERTAESPSLAQATPVPEPVVPPVETAVIPPAYMSTSENLGALSPNFSAIKSSQADDGEAISSVVANAPSLDDADSGTDEPEMEIADEPETEVPETEESESEEGDSEEGESEEGESEESESEEGESEESESGGAESEEGAGGEGAAAGEVSAADAENAGGATEDTATSTASTPQSGGGGDEEFESIEAMVAKLPKMSPIRPPYVGSPPPQAIQRRDEIIKRTGAPPDMHHAKVRQAAEQVTQAARDAQRRMINCLGLIGKDSRLSIEQMADQIMFTTASAVAQINGAIDKARADISEAATVRNNYLKTAEMLVGSQLEARGDQMATQVTDDLRRGSDAVDDLNTVAQAEFTNYLVQARTGINQVPTAGKGTPIPAPPRPAGARAPKPRVPPKPPTYEKAENTTKPLTEFAKQQAEAVKDGPNSKTYYESRALPLITGHTVRTQQQLVEAASKKASALDTGPVRSQFLINLLGLTTPVAEHHKFDRSDAEKKQEDALRASLSEVEYARHRAQATITEKSELAREYADTDLRKNLTTNLWKAGSKAAKSFRKQALAAEIAQCNNAAAFAEAYRGLVARLDNLLPKGQFLDSRHLVPKLMLERDSAFALQRQHENAAQQQQQATLAQMGKARDDQINGLQKSVAESERGIRDVVTQTSFDMEFHVMQVTNGMSEGASNVMAAATEYADRTAANILQSVGGTESNGIRQVQGSAVGFLNGQINAAEQGQYMRLESFVESMEQPGADGTLTGPMITAKRLFETKADELKTALPDPPSGTDIALGAAAVVAMPTLLLPAAVGLGVYLYEHNPSENGVITALGDVVYPGPPAIAEVFARKDYGDLTGKIGQVLDNPEKQQALDLFDTSPRTRGDARRHIAERSLDLFGYNRAARESALSGMSLTEYGDMNSAEVAVTGALLREDLNEHQADIATAFLTNNRERAVAARTRESLDNATRSATWGWIFSAQDAQASSDRARVDAVTRMDSNLRQVLAIENSFADTMTDAELSGSRSKMFSEFASLTTRRDASSFNDRSARDQFIVYSTWGHDTYVLGHSALQAGLLAPLGMAAGVTVDRQRVEMSDDAKNYIAAAVNNGVNSDEARTARGVYAIRSAEAESGRPSETTQMGLTEALENRTLARHERDAADPRKTPEERSRAARLARAEREAHGRRLLTMARALSDNPNSVSTPEQAEKIMRNRVGGLFARTDSIAYRLGLAGGESHSRYGEEMITHGRASLDASVALATDGLGTHDSLLTHGYADRSPQEIAEANARWSHEHHGENMEEMLGIRQRDLTPEEAALKAMSPVAWFLMHVPETSGDLSMQLEVLARGNPESDEERLAIAQLRQRQEERGTGFIAAVTMSGTNEEGQMRSTSGAVAEAIRAQAIAANPSLAKRFPVGTSIYGADGNLDPAIRAAAFDARGNFNGDRTIFGASVSTMGQAADAYRAEIDRQEAAMTHFITVMALVASIALMLIPGVNVVAAGMAVAIVAGAATIVVKAGMRGERYGWEEMATDVAMTAIEAATAGVSGGIAGGFKAGPFARLAGIGKVLESGFGKIGGAIAREVVVNAISAAASTAIQDDVWKDGLGKGLERVANGAIRGAVVAAVTTGVSESISHGLASSMSRAAADPTKVSRLAQLAERMGPRTSEMLREGLSNGVGALMSETVGLGIDYAQGNFHGEFRDALQHIGIATLRETLSGAARGGITAMHKENYRMLLEAAQKDPNISPSELKALRLVGISAGVLNYDTHLDTLKADINHSRQIIERLPPALREHVAGMDVDGLRNLERLLSSAEIGYREGNSKAQKEHLEFMQGLEMAMPGLDPRKLMAALDTAIDNRRSAPQEAIAPEQQQALRARLGGQLHEGIKFALDHLPMDGLQHLNDAELLQAAAMVASGKYNSEHADQLLRAVKARNPHVDEHSFLSNLQSAVMQSGHLQQAAANNAQVRREKLVELVPPEAAGLFAGLSDLDAVLAHNLLKNGDTGTPQQRDSLFQSARQQNPELTREQFHGFMTKAAEAARTRIATEASAQRVKREGAMSNVPEHLRSVLSALPEAGLVELRLRQMEGSVSPAEKNRLIELAKKATPDIDVHQLAHAIDEAIAKPAKQPLSDAQHADLRAHLLRGVPADLRSQIEHTPIMVLSEREFAALTRSAKGQAVTLIIDGKPVVILREGANPSALREEGIHALQAHDKDWALHIRSLDEEHLANWDKLSIEEQLVLYRNKLALEVDAQQRVIASLEADITGAKTPEERRALQRQLEQTRLAHENLSRRFGEVGGVSALDIANIKAGFSERPQWLDQPARLFNKAEDINAASEKILSKVQEDAAVKKKAEEERVERDKLLKQLTSDMKTPKSIAEWHERMKTHLDLDSLQSLAALHPDPEVARQVLKYALATVDPQGFIKQAHALVNRIGPDAGRELVGTAHGQKLLVSLAKDGQIGALDRVIFHCSDINELRGVLVRLGSDAVSNPAKLLGHLDNVLSLLKTNQAFEFLSRLSSMQIENVPDHIEAFSHITRNINDPAQVQAFMHLVGRLSAGEYFDFVLKWGVISSTLFPQLEKGLPHFYQGKLLSRVIEMAATQHEWKAFFDSAHDLLHTINGLPKTPGNADAINKVMRYLLDPYGQPIHLAADVFASVDQLRAPGATREAIFALQASHLTGKKTDRLAGSDTWHTRMESEALRWNSFKNNAATKPFADLLANHPASKHWSEGELGIVSNMHRWFDHLANLHGIASDDFSPAAVQTREKLLTRIFERGFGPTGEQVVSSAGKLVDLNRAFREMVVIKITEIDLDKLSGPRDPARVAAALNRAGIGEHQFAHFSNDEKEILLQHLYTLESRHAFYGTMRSLEHLGGGAHGAQQNITEVLGELALAAHMVINHQNLRLAIPFSKGTGFDQVWVGHNADGEKIYVIGEAKGLGAELGTPAKKGPQMSAEWVVETLREMLTSNNSAERALAKEMLLAIIRARDESIKTGTPMPPIVSGVVIEAGNPANKADASTGASGYDFRAFDFTEHTNILAGK